MDFVGKPDLFQHDRDLDAVWRRQRIELEQLRVLGRPALGDGKGGQIGHQDPGFVHEMPPSLGQRTNDASRVVRSFSRTGHNGRSKWLVACITSRCARCSMKSWPVTSSAPVKTSASIAVAN